MSHQRKGCIGQLVEAIDQIKKFFQIISHSLTYDQYVRSNQKLMDLITLKVKAESPDKKVKEEWSSYSKWPKDWKKKLKECYIAFAVDGKLPINDTLPISSHTIKLYPNFPNEYILYRNIGLARNVFFAQIAQVLWLEIEKKVPWRLAEWTESELSYLLSSKVYFEALYHPSLKKTVYGVIESSRHESTENMLGDPRIAYRFMSKDPEEQKNLIGKTPEETLANISGWFHDYLFHNPAQGSDYSSTEFLAKHPLLEHRLVKHQVHSKDHPVYLALGGCGSASSLLADLARSVNIPLQKINNLIGEPNNRNGAHSGLKYEKGGQKKNFRFMIHTDHLYYTPELRDPCPLPVGSIRGKRLWEELWLTFDEMEKLFSYASNPAFFIEASFKQSNIFAEYKSLTMVTYFALLVARGGFLQMWKDQLISRGHSEKEVDFAWKRIKDTVTTYGGGDLKKGYQVLLDGPTSRRKKWCDRTLKC